MREYEEIFSRGVKELNDPELYGCVPGAIGEPALLIHAERIREELKKRKRQRRRERRKKK